MVNELPIAGLATKVASGVATIDELAEFVSILMPQAVSVVNSVFSPRQLVKRDRTVEPLPTDKKQLSSYRTRLGTMLEYALSTHIDRELQSLMSPELRLTFAVAHEYPDFYLRDEALEQRVRIEMKAVDADSEEQAARFEVLQSLIVGEKDLVILIGWEWRQTALDNGTKCEYPEIFSFVVVPAFDLASERDTSVKLRGGRVDESGIFVPARGKLGELTRDQGNAGKILRIVHQRRRAEPFELSLHIQRYLQFVGNVESRAAAVRTAQGLSVRKRRIPARPQGPRLFD